MIAVGLLASLAGSPALAQVDILTGKPLESDKQSEVLTLKSGFVVTRGATRGKLSITADLQPGWHIASLTQKPGGTPPTKISLTDSKDFKLVGDFQPLEAPDKRIEPLFDNLLMETHEGQVTWQAAIDLKPGVDPHKLKIAGQVRYAACNDRGCRPPKSIAFTAPLVNKLPERASQARAHSGTNQQVGAPATRTVR